MTESIQNRRSNRSTDPARRRGATFALGPPPGKRGRKSSQSPTVAKSDLAATVRARAGVIRPRAGPTVSRVHPHGLAVDLRKDRTEAHSAHETAQKTRATELIREELQHGAAPPGRVSEGDDSARPQAAEGPAEARSGFEKTGPPKQAPRPPAGPTATAELIARVEELRLHQARPTLTLSLQGTANAQVQVERVDAGRVAVHLQGSKVLGPGGRQALSEALADRGLTLDALHMRP